PHHQGHSRSEEVECEALVHRRGEAGGHQPRRMLDSHTLQQLIAKAADQHGARAQQRLASMEIVDEPREETQDLTRDATVALDELAPGARHDRRQALVEAAEQQAGLDQLRESGAQTPRGSPQLTREARDVEWLVRRPGHTGQLEQPDLPGQALRGRVTIFHRAIKRDVSRKCEMSPYVGQWETSCL